MGKRCSYDFSGPSDHAFLTTFFYSYIILIFSKYSDKSRQKLSTILLILNGLLVVLIAFSLNYLGNTFLFQSLIGAVYGIIYCVLCISLDSEIHTYCEKAAFIVKSSRKYKFKLFFLCLILFVGVVVYFNAALVSFKVSHEWILNTIDDCHSDKSYEYRMGIDFTFLDTAVLFSVIGAVFGAATATTTIENILWSETKLYKRVLRGLIGAFVVVIIFFVVDYIPHEDHPTKYFFGNLIPHLVAAYCAFGLVPILSKYIGLVNKGIDPRESFISNRSSKVKVDGKDRSSSSSFDDQEEEDIVLSLTPPPTEEA
jgi:membrane-associated phospholipid phosphatase